MDGLSAVFSGEIGEFQQVEAGGMSPKVTYPGTAVTTQPSGVQFALVIVLALC